MSEKQNCGDHCSAGCGTQSSGCSAGNNQFHNSHNNEEELLQKRLGKIRHKILVLSGKGGVGKSTFATNLAVSLALAGKKVGLLDVDIHGPSVPGMLNVVDSKVHMENGAVQPIEIAGIKVMSVGFLLRDHDDAVIWRGPMKMSAIKQFLQDAEWGELDYLVVDSPPGTGDEPLTVAQLAAPVDGAVIVTTPQNVAIADVRKSVNFCGHLGVKVLGVVENMSGFACPHCNTVTRIFKSGGGEQMAGDMGVPFLGRIPIDPAIAEACDAGEPFIYHYSKTETAKAFATVIEPILALSFNDSNKTTKTGNSAGDLKMKFAVPMADGKLCTHFGHCEQFALLDVDPATNKVVGTQSATPPPHEPGVLPRWLKEQQVTHVIAGGMGQRAQELLAENGIKVIVGAGSNEPAEVVRQFLAGSLVTGDNVCDH
jgi:Mrp family chromosome partitioning ATPase/predicted Fe-Mo cluster-binding NifX family protein